MSNSYFRFKQFTIRQEHCAMKVGTDGTLLGAWARGGKNILDIGTGTGLIALMMAQRFPEADVVGIDIDAQAVVQAHANAALSPFVGRVSFCRADARLFETESYFASIVSNPPFYDNSLKCPDAQRSVARHTSLLGYSDLMAAARRLMSDDGEFSVVIPVECCQQLEGEAYLAGLFKVRQCGVKTTPRKPVRRYLLAFRKHPTAVCQAEEVVLELEPGHRSAWYAELTKDFYL